LKYFKYIFLAIILTSLGQAFIWTKGGDKIVIPPQIGDKLESLSYTPYKGFEKTLKSNEEVFGGDQTQSGCRAVALHGQRGQRG